MPSGTTRVRTELLVDRLVAEGLAALPDIEGAKRCLRELSVIGGDRALFATCVLTLECALLKDDGARAALPEYVGVLLEAYRDPRLANVLVAGSPDLEARWQRILPVVADFVALQRQPTVLAEVTFGEDLESVSVRTDPSPTQRLSTSVELIAEIEEIIEDVSAQPPRPPPMPLLTPMPPPPEPDLASRRTDPMRAAPPAPPAQAVWAPDQPRVHHALPPEPEVEQPIPPEVRSFWEYTEKALGRVPDPAQSMIGAQSFPVARSSDRTHLVRFAHDLVARYPQCAQARALAALTLLYVAAQEKERGLLGVNKSRLKLLRSGLALLGDARAAGQVAVLFESDGPDTRQAFAPVVDLVWSYLGFCAREGLDPGLPESAALFAKP